MDTASKSGSLYKTGFFILLVIFLIGGALTFGIWYGSRHTKNNNSSQPVLPTILPNTQKITISSLPTQKSEVENETPTIISTTVPTQQEKSDTEQIKEAIAAKYKRAVNEVELTVNKNDGTHASGGVRFSGEMAGGWVLAAKVNGSWVIVQDGNGTISCEAIAPYNFSNLMVEECVTKEGNLIKR